MFLSRPAVDNLNFPDNVTDMVKQFPLSRVAELKCWASKRQSQAASSSNLKSESAEEESEEPAAKVLRTLKRFPHVNGMYSTLNQLSLRIIII